MSEAIKKPQNKLSLSPQAEELPTIESLYKNKALTVEKNKLAILLNQPPAASWIAEHPLVKTKDKTGKSAPLQYLPIERVEWLMVTIYKSWWVEVKNIQLIGNAVVVTVRVWYLDPVEGVEKFTDGVGAQPLQTQKGAGATDWNKLNTMSVQMAAPSAESFAIKDACEKLGKLFGKDLNRGRDLNFIHLNKQEEKIKSLDDKFTPAPKSKPRRKITPKK